jgi:hypothetical protein
MSCRLLDRGKGNTAISVAYGSIILAAREAPILLLLILILILILIPIPLPKAKIRSRIKITSKRERPP